MWLGVFLTFILGTAVGSFLNVVIDRGPQERTVLAGRSACDWCGRTLNWAEMVPVLSYLCLRGRCRTCAGRLSRQYPLVEGLTGVVFAAVFWWVTSDGGGSFPWVRFVSCLILASGLLVILVSDFKYCLIPDRVIWPLISLAILARATFSPPLWGLPLFVALGASAFFTFLILITRGRGMGWGDVKLAFLLGLVGGWPRAVVGFGLSFLTGAAVGLMLVLMGRKSLKQTIPFGPFLIGGAFLSLIFGQNLWDWYLTLL